MGEFEFATPKRVASAVPAQIAEVSDRRFRCRPTVSSNRLQIRTEPDECRAKMGGHVVAEFLDLREAVECGLHHTPLHAAAAPVDHTHFSETSASGSRDVLL